MNLDPRTMTQEDFDEAETRDMLLSERRDCRSQSYGLTYTHMLRWRRDTERGIKYVPLPPPRG